MGIISDIVGDEFDLLFEAHVPIDVIFDDVGCLKIRCYDEFEEVEVGDPG